MSKKEDDKESKEPDYDNDRNQLEEDQEQESGEQEATSNLLETFEGKVQLAKYITNHFKAIYPYEPHNDFRHKMR